MIRQLSIFSIAFLLLFGITNCQKKDKEQFIESIVGLTADELPVFVTLRCTDQEAIYLISNLELHWLLYPALDITEEYLDTLRHLLINEMVGSNQCSKLDKTKVSIVSREALQEYSTSELYDRFFDERGLPKGNQKQEVLEAAVSILVERGVIVQQGSAAMYNIYVKP